jgi:hypothetical protein
MSKPTDEKWDEVGLAARVAEVEHRVDRLETAIAEHPPEDEAKLTDRVLKRLTELAAERSAGGDRVVVLDSANERRAMIPVAPEPPAGAVLEPTPTIPASAAKRGWFFAQVWSEFRLVFQMYFDPRYRISRTTQFVIPAILLLLVLNYFLFSVWMSVPVLSPLVERVVVLFFGIVAWMVLARETARYREVLDYLAKYGR